MNGILNRVIAESRCGAEGAVAILWADMAALHRSLPNYLLATVAAPLLYIAAFVFGLGGNIKMDGMSYLDFVVPGIIAMTAMNSSFNGAGTRLVIDQIHWRTIRQHLHHAHGFSWRNLLLPDLSACGL